MNRQPFPPHPARELRPADLVAVYSWTPADALGGGTPLMAVLVTDHPRGTEAEVYEPKDPPKAPLKATDQTQNYAQQLRGRLAEPGVVGFGSTRVIEAVTRGPDRYLIRVVQDRIDSLVQARWIAKRLAGQSSVPAGRGSA